MIGHMARRYGIKAVAKSFDRYREQLGRCGWSHTLDQWRDFLEVPSRGGKTISFADTQHACYFDSVLGTGCAILGTRARVRTKRRSNDQADDDRRD